jgi:hypothetical protein
MTSYVRSVTVLAVSTLALAASSACAQMAAAPQLIASAPTPTAFAATTETQPSPDVNTAVPGVSSSASAAAELPDAPSASLRASTPEADQPARTGGTPAPKYEKSISPDETAQPLTGGDKVILSLRQLYAPLSIAGEVLSGGYTHLVNGSPNYGRNGEAAGKRIGAAVVRGSSQELFADAIFCPIMHMDPRYYVQGSQHNFVHRAFYAATRVLVSKTDSGRTTVNAPLLLAYAGTAALDMAYYPEINRNVKDGVSDFGGSLGGAAIGFLFNEFADPLLRAVHLQSK